VTASFRQQDAPVAAAIVIGAVCQQKTAVAPYLQQLRRLRERAQESFEIAI